MAGRIQISEGIFNVLRKNGCVYILRPRMLPHRRVNIWYSGLKVAIGTIDYIGDVVRHDGHLAVNGRKLDDYVHESGFRSVDEWIDSVYSNNGLRLYKVRIIRWYV